MSLRTRILFLVFTTVTIFTPLATCHSNLNRRSPFPNPDPQNNDNLHNKRQDVLCPIPCDNRWCCYNGQKCIPNNDPAEPYQCDDPILQTTWEAFQNGYLSSVLVAASSAISGAKSLISEYNLTTPATVTSTGTATSTGGGGGAATESGPITLGLGPTRTGSSTVATTTGTSCAPPCFACDYTGNIGLGGVVITAFAFFRALL